MEKPIIANGLMRKRFVGAFTPEQAQLRIATTGTGVRELDGISTFVKADCLGDGGGADAGNAFEIEQHRVVHLQLHAAFASDLEGIISAQVNFYEPLEDGGEAATRQERRRGLANRHLKPEVRQHR